jgi:hypothetical protein
MMSFLRKFPGWLLVVLFIISIQTSGATAAVAAHSGVQSQGISAVRQVRGQGVNNTNVQLLRQLKQSGRIAATVNILSALPPVAILQFPLVPSGIKKAFPSAKGLVTIVRGNRDNSTSDTVTIDVQNMPPNITFTIFFIEIASKPFGHVEYVADLTTRGDGSGESVFQCIAFVAFAMDAHNPGVSRDIREGLTSGINLEHLGMWFSSLQDAQKVLNDNTLKGTIFDGGSPALHAGPQALTDGQTAPVVF